MLMPRVLLPLSCVLILTACQKPDTPQHGGTDGVAIASPAPRPENGAAPAAMDAQNTLDENDRIIADNKRMVAALQEYSRIDSAKLNRLTTVCQGKLGGTLADGGAKKVFDCIKSSW